MRAAIPSSGLTRRELWIGLVELKPLNRQACGAAGAFTNILTWADSLSSFTQKAGELAVSLNMYDVEGAEPLRERTSRVTLTAEVEDMLTRAESNPEAIVYGTFHSYPFDAA